MKARAEDRCLKDSRASTWARSKYKLSKTVILNERPWSLVSLWMRNFWRRWAEASIVNAFQPSLTRPGNKHVRLENEVNGIKLSTLVYLENQVSRLRISIQAVALSLGRGKGGLSHWDSRSTRSTQVGHLQLWLWTKQTVSWLQNQGHRSWKVQTVESGNERRERRQLTWKYNQA